MSWVLYVGGDHKEEPGREDGAKKGARKEGLETGGGDEGIMLAAALAR